MTVHRAAGFALNRNNFHVLRIHIVRVRNPQLGYRKSLLEANSRSGAKMERHREEEDNCFYRGCLQLGGNDYKLTGIIIMYENGETRNYTADIFNQPDSVRVGNISVILRTLEGARIGEGSLTMNHTHEPVVYRVLLSVGE